MLRKRMMTSMLAAIALSTMAGCMASTETGAEDEEWIDGEDMSAAELDVPGDGSDDGGDDGPIISKKTIPCTITYVSLFNPVVRVTNNQTLIDSGLVRYRVKHYAYSLPVPPDYQNSGLVQNWAKFATKDFSLGNDPLQLDAMSCTATVEW
jgi:hypothetical protein